MKRQIVNIINFIRAVEPREEIDLITPVKEQIAALERHDLPGTFLLQYDALIDRRFTDMLKTTSGHIEVGVWLEIVQPLAEDAGLAWRGRPGFAWDWHAHVGFSVGYTQSERVKIIDTLMERFFREFGYYPASVGSWIIDAFSLGYMADKYGITASCNCKDQWGTDGYTLWGGYYGQAYYPSRLNAYTPAQTPENQIPVPIFKMLGSDPIYQYDIGLSVDSEEAPSWQHVVTLEPVYSGASGGGGEPAWVDWYLRENFNGLCIHFGYTQAGQENSFGWDAMKNGLTYQLARIAQLAKNNMLEVMTLGDTGAWFRSSFSTTPPTAIAALSDWKNKERKSIWFNSKRYRINIYMEKNLFWIRDWHLFDENYTERYMDTVCTESVLCYDNLPIVDGNRWSGGGLRSGMYPVLPTGEPITFTDVTVSDADGALSLCFTAPAGDFCFRCSEDEVFLSYAGQPFTLELTSDKPIPVIDVTEHHVTLRYNNHCYALSLERGVCRYQGWSRGKTIRAAHLCNREGLDIASDKESVIQFRISDYCNPGL